MEEQSTYMKNVALNRQIFDLYNKGMSGTEISNKLNISRGLIYSRLAKMPGYKAHKIYHRHEKRPILVHIPEPDPTQDYIREQLLAQYNNGYTLSDLAIQENISSASIGEILKATGHYKPHPINFPNTIQHQGKDLMAEVPDVKIKRDKMTAMYASGSSMREIGEVLGWCQERVIYSLRRLGYHVYSMKGNKMPKVANSIQFELKKLNAGMEDIQNKLTKILAHQNSPDPTFRWIPITEEQPSEDGQCSMMTYHGVVYWCRLPPLPELNS